MKFTISFESFRFVCWEVFMPILIDPVLTVVWFKFDVVNCSLWKNGRSPKLIGVELMDTTLPNESCLWLLPQIVSCNWTCSNVVLVDRLGSLNVIDLNRDKRLNSSRQIDRLHVNAIKMNVPKMNKRDKIEREIEWFTTLTM